MKEIESYKKMKNKKIVILLSLFFIFGFIFKITPIRAISTDQTISTVAEKDSYVESGGATSNYGGKNWLIFGDRILGWNEAYLYFNFSNKPTGWTKAEVSIDMYSISETFNVTASLITNSWDELTITWLNKPVHGEVITTFTVAEGNIYKIDVTDYIAGRDYISICLNASDYLQGGYVQARSREGSYSWSPEGYPQFIWTYLETTEITVTSPTSSSDWQELNTYTIMWTSLGTITDVVIQLYKGDTFVEDITYTYTDNDGSYDFYVSSSDNYDGTDYQIKIIDYDDSNVFVYSDYFSINIHAGAITVTNPTSGSSWKPGSSYDVTWTSTGTISLVDIDFYKGTTYLYYLNGTSDDGSYTWLLPTDIEQGSNWRIKISNSGNSDEFDWSDYFKISEGGTITVTNPTSGSSWKPGSSYDITWTSTGLIDTVEIDVYKGNILTYFSNAETDDGSYTWEVPADIEQGSNWQIKISNSDYSDEFDWSGEFKISKSENAIVGFNPFLILWTFFLLSIFFARKIMRKH